MKALQLLLLGLGVKVVSAAVPTDVKVVSVSAPTDTVHPYFSQSTGRRGVARLFKEKSPPPLSADKLEGGQGATQLTKGKPGPSLDTAKIEGERGGVRLFKGNAPPPPSAVKPEEGRGGARLLKGKSASVGKPKGRFLPVLGEKISNYMEKSIERTLYSKENQPESNGHAEWNGFLSGWLLVALPVPLPILVSALSMNALVLVGSKWTDAIKNKYLIGLSHGSMVLLVLLRTLEANTGPNYEGIVSPRVALIGLNLATNLLFGHAGSYSITKLLMDFSISTTLLYLLFHYLR